MRGLLLVALTVCLVACGRGSPSGPSRPGSPDAAPARSAAELVSGAGRMTGGTLTLDVQLGHAVEQRPTANGTTTLSGGAAVRP